MVASMLASVLPSASVLAIADDERDLAGHERGFCERERELACHERGFCFCPLHPSPISTTPYVTFYVCLQNITKIINDEQMKNKMKNYQI